MIPAENKNTIHSLQRLLLNCLLHDLEIVTVNGGDSTSQYHTQLVVAKFTGNRKKIQSGYFIATPRTAVRSQCLSISGKAIPAQVWAGPEGSKRMRLPA
jgi:hypothetical protein